MLSNISPKSFFNSFIFAFLPHAITVSLLLVHREQVSSHDDEEENDSDTGGGGGNNADGRNNNSSSNTRSNNNRAGAAAAAAGDNIELEERGRGRGGDLLARETTLVRLILQRGTRGLGEYLTTYNLFPFVALPCEFSNRDSFKNVEKSSNSDFLLFPLKKSQ